MLIASHVTKSYGPLRALDDVSASFAPGEIHAVLGENGAGKSTLVGILSGFTKPDSGTVTLDAHPIPLGKAFECKRAGIEMIHQHFTLVPEFTVAENLGLARLDNLKGVLNTKQLAANGLKAAANLGWEIDPDVKVRNLPVGVQQRLEILKALSGDAKVLAFDEPTAVLTPDEVDDLFRVLRELKGQGKIVILIAHKLSEVMKVADRVTVLRKGKFIATAPISEVDPDKLAFWMVGEMPESKEDTFATHLDPGLVVKGLKVKGDRGEEALKGISFDIHRGEILGFGGVDGNGQIELAEALAQVRRAEGDWTFENKKNIQVSYVPQNRQTDGLALRMSIRDNMLVTGHRYPGLSNGPWLNLKRIKQWAEQLKERFDIKASNTNERVDSLSGGNQQKVVLSRSLDIVPDLLIVANPTRGLDIKATEFVHAQIRNARDQGAAVALITTDLDELYALSSRRYFLSRGELVEDTGVTALVGGP